MFKKLILLLTLLATITYQKRKIDLFQAQIDEYHQDLLQEYKSHASRNKAHFQEIIGNKKNICTGEKAYTDKKEYLEAFAKGPCAPTAFIPGIGGSKFRVIINCMQMKLYNQDLFKSCGWSSCGQGLFGAPLTEYVLWIPSPITPMSFIQPTPGKRECFVGLMSVAFEIKGKKITINENPGVKVVTIGESPETIGYEGGHCGFDSIRYLIDFRIVKKIQEMSYFGDLMDAFENAGYISGLTMQALPYNWRIGYAENRLDYKFERTLKMLNAITGKKVLIASHSMGNLNTLHNIWKLTDEQKENLIARYIAMAPPFIGSSYAPLTPLGNDPSFGVSFSRDETRASQEAELENNENKNNKKSWLSLGITAKMMKGSVMMFPAMYQLMPRFFYKVHEDKIWMHHLKQRIHEENNGLKHDTNNFLNHIFPDAKKTCNSGFKQRNLYEDGALDPDDKIDGTCKTGLYELWDLGKVKDLELNPDTLSYAFDSYSFLPEARNLWEWSQDARFDEMANPKVQVTILYATHLAAKKGATFTVDPRERTLNNEFFYPNYQFVWGDGTVAATSAISPGVKWGYEHEAKQEGAKPVVFAEVCGEHSVSASIFDGVTKNISKNKYVGVRCNCREKKAVVGKKCDHQNLISDAGIVSFVLNSAIDGQEGKVGPEYSKMTAEDLDKFVDGCTIFNYEE